MTQENIIKLLAGASKIVRESKEIIKSSSAGYIEDSIVKGKYVSREEHENLKKLVLKLEKTVSGLIITDKE